MSELQNISGHIFMNISWFLCGMCTALAIESHLDEDTAMRNEFVMRSVFAGLLGIAWTILLV